MCLYTLEKQMPMMIGLATKAFNQKRRVEFVQQILMIRSFSFKIKFQVLAVYVHENFDGRLESLDHDIALIKIQTEVTFTSKVAPACLWPGPADEALIGGRNGTVIFKTF
jgi:Trypsin